MRISSIFFIFLFIKINPVQAQEASYLPSFGLYTGMVNYEGDLKPNSFTFNHSNPFLSLSFRLPFNRWFVWRSGISIGKVEGADKYNRNYLKPRNLSFFTNLKEAYTGLEVPFLDPATKRFIPYVFGGAAVFKFNPWTFDNDGNKVYLKPLSTEGEGLPDYPDRKPYKLTQAALTYAIGMKYAITDCFMVGVEFNQRKTFTDYLDDVSSSYIDQAKLFAAKGQRAVDLAYRGDELPNGTPYPPDGEQRGTPTEKDWYYFLGVTLEMKLGCITGSLPSFRFGKKGGGNFSKCPKF